MQFLLKEMEKIYSLDIFFLFVSLQYIFIPSELSKEKKKRWRCLLVLKFHQTFQDTFLDQKNKHSNIFSVAFITFLPSHRQVLQLKKTVCGLFAVYKFVDDQENPQHNTSQQTCHWKAYIRVVVLILVFVCCRACWRSVGILHNRTNLCPSSLQSLEESRS